MKVKKEILLLIIITGLIVYFLIGDSKVKLWSAFYFLNSFSLILLLTTYNFDKRFRTFIIHFCILNMIRIITKFVIDIDLDALYKLFFACLYIRFFIKNLLNETNN